MTSTRPVASGPACLLVVGDGILDRDVVGTTERLAPDAPVPVLDESRVVERPGGAGLAAVLLAGQGHRVRLLTAISDDQPGGRLHDLLVAAGIEVAPVPFAGGSTREKTRMLAGDRPLLRWDRGRPGPLFVDRVTLDDAAAGAEAVLVSDYGGGLPADPVVREWLAHLAGQLPVVWDPHPRGARPVPGCVAVTPNLDEARRLAPEGSRTAARATAGDGVAAAAALARSLHQTWNPHSVVVTLGARGALLFDGRGGAMTVSPPVLGGGAAPDTCGAGDRFAGELTALLALGASIPEAAAAAVTAASRFVLAGAAGALSASPVTGSSGTVPDQAVPDGSIPGWEAVDGVTRRVREHDGVVVATGGVFDLLHVGHVSYLERARALGDALVVLVNGDDSVRRLKGPDRPLQPLADRMAVLTALGCVDAVVAFDDDTPVSALERLRPDLWVKGGDYAGVTLPEAAVLADWGGEVVVLPYLDGRSTTQLITRARGPSRGEVTPQGRPRVPPRVPAPPGAPDVASREGAP